MTPCHLISFVLIVFAFIWFGFISFHMMLAFSCYCPKIIKKYVIWFIFLYFWTPKGPQKDPPGDLKKQKSFKTLILLQKDPPGDPPNITFRNWKRYNYWCFETWAILDASRALIDFHHQIWVKIEYRWGDFAYKTNVILTFPKTSIFRNL